MIHVLNAGYVDLLRFMGGDEAIIQAARVCYQTQGNAKADERLIGMLIRENHRSPFEHCVFTFKVRFPLFVRDHWVRHRMASYNILSLRYCEAKPEFFVPEELPIGSPIYNDWVNKSIDTFEDYLLWVDYFISQGCSQTRARELSRTKLPSEIYTEAIITMNMSSLLNFLDLRDAPDAQPETRLYAKAILSELCRACPVTMSAYLNNKKERV